MATQLFLLQSATGKEPDVHLGTDNALLNGTNQGWSGRQLLGLTRNSSLTTGTYNTVTGPTAGVEVVSGNPASEFISPPLSTDVTIAGTITANIWAAESSMNANVSICMVVEVIRANVLGTRNSNTIVEIARRAPGTEIAVTTRAVNNFTMTPTSTVVNRGDRLRVRVFGDDVTGGVNMASGFTFSWSYNANTAAADGDTYVTFTEDFSFESAPGGSVLYLTNTQSGLTAAPALISDFTGADENPLSEGGNWANLNTSLNPLKLISNAASGISGISASYWTPANFGPDLEAYMTVNGAAAGFIGFRIQGEGGAGTWDGYLIGISGASVIFYSVTNATLTSIFQPPGATWAVGDKLGVRCEGSTLQAWRQASGGSDWDLYGTVVNTTYSSAGKIALLVNSTTVRMDDFYAATDSNLFTQKAWTSRGSGVVSYLSDTDAGWTAPLLTNEWFTPGLTAFTLTGMAVANIRALESNASANASLRCEVARVDNDGTNATVWASWCIAPVAADQAELTTSEVARTCNVSGDDLAFTDGQRIRVRLYNEDQSFEAMGNAFNTQVFYNGTSAAASGDTYITLAQSVTEFTPAALVLTQGFVNFSDPGVL